MDTGDNRDISPTGTGSVLYDELFPAVKIAANIWCDTRQIWSNT